MVKDFSTSAPAIDSPERPTTDGLEHHRLLGGRAVARNSLHTRSNGPILTTRLWQEHLRPW